eukprot:gene9247-biopygen6194
MSTQLCTSVEDRIDSEGALASSKRSAAAPGDNSVISAEGGGGAMLLQSITFSGAALGCSNSFAGPTDRARPGLGYHPRPGPHGGGQQHCGAAGAALGKKNGISGKSKTAALQAPRRGENEEHGENAAPQAPQREK